MLRHALIGCGRVSSTHIEAIAHFYKENKMRLVALCDIDESRAITSKNLYNKITGDSAVNTYSLIDEMLEKEQLDSISICTPSGLHPEHGIKAAKKGINVLSEKPIGCSIEEAKKLIETCDELGVKLFVVKQNRLNPTCASLLNAVDTGRFGRIYMIQSNVFWLRTQDYYDGDPWRGKIKLDGGAFLNQAVHYADMVQRIGGPIESVASFIDHLARDIEAEDTGCAVIKFKNGAIGNLNTTMLTSLGDYEGSLTVIGEKGFVKIGGNCLNQIQEWSFKEPLPEDTNIKNNNYSTSCVYGHGHVGIYGKMIDSLTENAPIFVDGNEGLKSLQLVMAIYQSSNEKKVVTL